MAPWRLLLPLLLLVHACTRAPAPTSQNPPVPTPFPTPPSDRVRLVDAFPELEFELPVGLYHAGDDRLFVVEQAGLIRVLPNRPEAARAEVFLDIQEKVESGGEKGLLGLAFHPDFTKNGLFYVDYTAPDPLRTVVSEFGVDPEHPERVDPVSERILLAVEQPYVNHNGGQLAFGPDGFLYIAMGDGGGGGDPQGNAQNPETLLGSILRIDVDRPSGDRPYGIPEDNPLAGNGQGFREEIYAYGLRNPWRFSFDGPTGELWAADVGQGTLEELDRIEKGGNYGWDLREGTLVYHRKQGKQLLEDPCLVYGRDLGGCITGGFVYRGTAVPRLSGRYVFGDFLSGRVWAFDKHGVELLLETGLPISSFGTDAAGELYLVNYRGKIFRFAPAPP